MKPRPKHRITRRFMDGANYYDDQPRMRFVVYRRAYGVAKKTSIRYMDAHTRTEAEELAQGLAKRLRNWPAEALEKFRFNP